MRWVHLTVIILLAAITVIFAAQNFQIIRSRCSAPACKFRSPCSSQ